MQNIGGLEYRYRPAFFPDTDTWPIPWYRPIPDTRYRYRSNPSINMTLFTTSDGSIYPIESISTIFCRIETYRNRRYFPGHPNDFGTHQLGSNISNFTWIKILSQSRCRRLLGGRLDARRVARPPDGQRRYVSCRAAV